MNLTFGSNILLLVIVKFRIITLSRLSSFCSNNRNKRACISLWWHICMSIYWYKYIKNHKRDGKLPSARNQLCDTSRRYAYNQIRLVSDIPRIWIARLACISSANKTCRAALSSHDCDANVTARPNSSSQTIPVMYECIRTDKPWPAYF